MRALVLLLLLPVPVATAAIPGGDCSGVVDVLCEERTTVCNGEICYVETRYCALWVRYVVDWPIEEEPPFCYGRPPS